MFKIGNFYFEEKWEDRGTSLMYFEADEEYEESAQWSIDISCRREEIWKDVFIILFLKMNLWMI
ncbi:MAG: hypothetical protein U0K86_11220 [Agathobacter sp.]|nr:hypothetical protein [Agathobacter sp.]